MSKLKDLQSLGQSVWLDYIRRSLLEGGELKRMVEEDGLRGVTSNPSIFEKAISGSSDYDSDIETFIEADPKGNEETLFEELAIEDIRMAADILRPVYNETGGGDGFVSIEVSPHLAYDTKGTVKEAIRLWQTIDRPNIMIKVPATTEGIPAIERLISDGINVNVTLIFSLSHYEAVAHAYIRGLKKCRFPGKVSSVASFFVSRVDTAVDAALKELGTPDTLNLRGRIATANAKAAYRRFKEIFYGSDFAAMRERGARVQRPLWASTGTKNPEYSDILYVEGLIGRDTVNTLPPATLNAFKDHGTARPSIETGLEEAEAALNNLKRLGINLDKITQKLQDDGVASFSASYDKLTGALKEKRLAIIAEKTDRMSLSLGGLKSAVDKRLKTWHSTMFSCRLWKKDPTIWFTAPKPEITDRLGWLTLPETMSEEAKNITDFAKKVKDSGVKDIVLLGMGGSSLAPYVFQHTFGNAPDYPKLTVLDSTHPAAVRAVEARVSLNNTLFLVSSKSGTTLETLSLFRYFWSKFGEDKAQAGRHFAAITDPGTPLESLAEERDFLKTFHAPQDVGGRYSALSVFGLVPAALIGVDISRLLDQAQIMSEGCAFCVQEKDSHCLRLGACLGELALGGKDKVTFLTSPALSAFPSWIEQLIAESTGKEGKGIIPVVDEPLGPPKDYGDDRLFVYISLNSDDDKTQQKHIDEIKDNGFSLVHICLNDKYELAQEIFRWEVAVASAGAALGIHPFNQPDVQLAKKLAKEVMEEGKTGDRTSSDVGDDTMSITQKEEIRDTLKELFTNTKRGAYLGIQAYLSPSREVEKKIQLIRLLLMEHFKLTTTFGYGPRFLHSTGQIHKGGPDSGIFLQLIDDPADIVPVPETDYTFNSLIHAQSLGDYHALTQRGRQVARVGLGKNASAGLDALIDSINMIQ